MAAGGEGLSDRLDLGRGVYAIRVFSTQSGATGDFEIAVFNSFGFCSGTISLGDSFGGTLTGLCPTVIYDFELGARTHVIFEMTSTTLDSFLEITDLSGAAAVRHSHLQALGGQATPGSR